ncbi:PREDICTED: YLP motif-containing protein 1 isoform X2 [Populus euphratica]|uniref:YLP motif-containing protein 1 isoform X2 n=1 Tax=Populus euphratica TaxID=75702 RepID=A0AAJ6VEW9_POPEU|nr:PREDICTED: YLP motif-containing protein 1 isoform X2 [Populus euphratica]
MDHQWRPMPPIHPTSICPICSFSHFPFCPPPPPPPPQYNQSPIFPPPPPQPEHPYHSGPPNPYMVVNPNQGWQWHREDGYGHPNPMYDYYRNSTASCINGEADRSYKRPRVDGSIGSGMFGYVNNQSPANFFSDDERRLKLIRDHGNTTSLYSPFPPTHDDMNSNNWKNQPMPNSAEMRRQQLPIESVYHENNRVFGGHPPPPPPPPPTSPPPPLPMEPPLLPSPPKSSSALFPVPINSAATNPYLHNHSSGFVSEEWKQSSGKTFLHKKLSPERPIVVDASHLFKMPHRATRPNHIVIILRGLPGSGKSYLAKTMRDLEVENGGNVPRIHSMDDYFMTEVEKVEDGDASKSSSSTRGKKPIVKKVVMEYCYEPEMEEAYRESLLKAFKKTLEEGTFTLVIVDDRNLRVADFAQFWAIAKRSGYEVYISEATYKDPVGCAARNVHGFTIDEIQTMARLWEEAPLIYTQLDIKSLFCGDDLKKNGIQEVDMDTEDGDFGSPSNLQEGKPEKTIVPPIEDAPHDSKRWDAEEDHPSGLKELGKSKWSDDLDEGDTQGSESMRTNNALSGLVQAYQKQRKSVHWSDQVGDTGFSIVAAKKANMLSLVIGPGAGYNLKTNPLSEEERPTSTSGVGKSRQSMFQERLRVEHESFKAVFDRRKQRIGGLDSEEYY